jgi:hypothetical protein
LKWYKDTNKTGEMPRKEWRLLSTLGIPLPPNEIIQFRMMMMMESPKSYLDKQG